MPLVLLPEKEKKSGRQLRLGKEWIMTEKNCLPNSWQTMKTVSNAAWEEEEKLVFGEGNPRSRIFLLGEAPGAKEDETGRPFVGRAGELLTELLALDGIDRQDVYITGSCKCRPPKNRNPYRKELTACRPLLERQIEIIKPRVVVCMGLVAVHNLLDRSPSCRCADAGSTDRVIRFIPPITRHCAA